MKRTVDDALLALRGYVRSLKTPGARGEVSVLVYPPEREAEMLAKLPAYIAALTEEGYGVELVDLGQRLAAELDSRPELRDDLIAMEASSPEDVLDDLGVIGTQLATREIINPLPADTLCRVLANLGALAPFVSYSAITNDLYGSTEISVPPTVLAFPGEGDERSLNLLRLRVDTAYRVPRI